MFIYNFDLNQQTTVGAAVAAAPVAIAKVLAKTICYSLYVANALDVVVVAIAIAIKPPTTIYL